MDMSNSQYNSASESGWTNYLDHSSLSESHFHRRGGYGETMEEEEEEDLSMVSDASSGPPHYHQVEDDQPYSVNWHPHTSQYTKESEKKVKEYGRNQQPSSLDDTASSPALNYSKKKISFSGNGAVEKTLAFSPCFSATRIKRKPKFQKHSSLLERSFGGKQASEEPGGLDEEEKK